MVRGRGRMGIIRNTSSRTTYKGKSFVPRLPFDIYVCESAFTRVNPLDDSTFTQVLLKRNSDLSPTSQEQASLLSLVAKVQGILDNLIVSPESFLSAQIEEVRQVGSFKKGTMLTGNNSADIVVILKTLPTKEAIEALGNKILEELNAHHYNNGFKVQLSEAKVHILIATIPQNVRKIDSELHMDSKLVQNHLAAIRHSRWFEENASHSSIKVLIRLLQGLKRKYAGLQPLNPWMIDLLSHYSSLQGPNRQLLAINHAFRRCFQLLAAGLFLPGSAGISDLCEANNVRVHTTLTLDQQDMLCSTAQTILRVISYGGISQVIGLEDSPDITMETTEWNDVIVSPLIAAYEKPLERKDTEETIEEVESEQDDIENLENQI